MKTPTSPTTRRPARKQPAPRKAAGALDPSATNPLVDVRRVRAGFGLSRGKFQRLLGFSVRAQASWEAGTQLPGEAVVLRLRELDRLRTALARVMEPTAIPVWLDTPNPAFEGFKPLELIERGQVDRLWRMVFELESGQPG